MGNGVRSKGNITFCEFQLGLKAVSERVMVEVGRVC
jgi:hypothetical protein